jgi:hypothetical protein
MSDYKECTRCKHAKPLCKFGKTGTRNNKPRTHSWCRSCQTASQTKSRALRVQRLSPGSKDLAVIKISRLLAWGLPNE